MVDITSRFRPLDVPKLRPGCCFLCRGTQNGPFIDTGVSIQWEGAIIICRACITQMFTQLDLPIIVNEEEIQERVEVARNEGILLGRETTLEAFRGYVADFSLNDSVVVASVSAGVDSSDTFEGAPKKRRSPKPSDAEKQQSPESGNAEGSGNLSGDSAEVEHSSVESDGTPGEPGRDDLSSDSSSGDVLKGIAF